MRSLTSRRGGRLAAAVAIWLIASVLEAAPDSQSDNRHKKVLVLNSWRPDEQFALAAERELPARLAAGLSEGVDYYTEHLDSLRFPQLERQDPFVEFLHRKYAGMRFDLVVVLGDSTTTLMIRNRQMLFPDTPVVFYALHPPEGRIANSTGLLVPFKFDRSLDLALALQPDLEHVYVVSGRSEFDRKYEQQVKEDFQRFEQRLDFTYLAGLVTSELEKRLSTLPAKSAVYYVLVSEDGAGEHFQQMAYLSRVASVANAPTYSWADATVDVGIVGGRRRDQVAALGQLAAMALRVLRSGRVDDVPAVVIDTDADLVDWRQLRRWRLDESLVPAGARVLFRAPSMWDQYEQYIVGTVIVVVAQTTLIAGLLAQRIKRRRIERELRGSEASLRVSYDRIRHLSRRLLGEQEAERARIARELHDDINSQLTVLAVELDRLGGDHQVRGTTRFARALEAAHGVATSVRELSHRLHPARLQLIGLVAAIESLRRDLSPPEMTVEFCHRDVPPDLDPDIALCLFRVAQEALGNAIKHSGARRVRIDLAGEPSCVALAITDDGKGFDVEHRPHGGLGLVSMRERVESVGGVLQIHATPMSGTFVAVTVPAHLPTPESALGSVGVAV